MSLRPPLVLLVLLLVAAAPFGYKAVVGTSYRNFRVVQPGVLYRSGQMSRAGFERVCREHGIRTVVKLREANDEKEKDKDVALDEAQKQYCQAHGLGFVRFPLADWTPVNGVTPGDANVRRFVALMADPAVPKPVLVHCFAGIHRTGPLVAAFRMEVGGGATPGRWSNDDAIAEMTSMGTVRTTFADNLLAYLRKYPDVR